MLIPPSQAIQRDLTQYIANHASRPIPVGYSAAEVRELTASTWAYLQCAINGDANDPSRIDFFGLNTYAWCGSDATFESSGYNQLVEQLGNTSVPVFLSEYGCNRDRPRPFAEVPVIYGPQMTSVLSGGLVYEYSQEESDYGLVELQDDGSAELMADYDNLQQQYSRLDLALLSRVNNGSTNAPPRCEEDLISAPRFNTSFELPPTPSDAEKFIEDGIPNPNQGKLVDVSKTTVSQRVVDSRGNPVENLAVRLLPNDQSNNPGPVPSTVTGTAASPSATRQGAASRQLLSSWVVGALFGVAVLASMG